MPIIKKDHTKLLCDIGELTQLFSDSATLEAFLKKIVEMIAEHMNSDVCSIYLYNEDSQELILKATRGLNPDSIGNVRLKLGEGLTGIALKELRPICERHASKNPNFRYFPGLGEEIYESFLAVPIIRGTTMIGVMVIQNTQKNYFTNDDIRVLKAITSQLANTIEMTRLILSIEEKREKRRQLPGVISSKLVKGKCGAPGFAFAEAIILGDDTGMSFYAALELSHQNTIADFHQAVEVTEKQLQESQKTIEEKLSDVASLIFTAQILMLKDKGFIDSMAELMAQGIAPVTAVINVVETYVKKFETIANPYLREKSQDVRDIGKRLLENLLGKEARGLSLDGRIVIAREIFPSDALKLSSQNVKGIILLSGGVTSHVSILARSLGLPVIITDVQELLTLAPKTKIIMDAEQGNIYINPSSEVVNSFKEREKATQDALAIQDTMTPTTTTKDGTRVILLANINLLGDLKNARLYKAEGIGLYRTEFPFIVRSDFPGEEEQFVIYKKLVDEMPGKEITFRTLDIGGDKVLSYFQDHGKEKNPYMGMRSIRFSLRHVDIFSQQIRAILRAGFKADIKIMFPMISSLDEFIAAKEITLSCIEDLRRQKIEHHSNPKIGLMIELPSVVEIIEHLAQEADFFSIGTNDFTQYMLAIDRSNEKVAELYLPHHPSILRAMRKVAQAAQKYNKDISVCGDMAHEEKYLSYFLGIGIRKFSLNPNFLPKIQNALKGIDLKEAQKKTEELLKRSRVDEINRMIHLA